MFQGCVWYLWVSEQSFTKANSCFYSGSVWVQELELGLHSWDLLSLTGQCVSPGMFWWDDDRKESQSLSCLCSQLKPTLVKACSYNCCGHPCPNTLRAQTPQSTPWLLTLGSKLSCTGTMWLFLINQPPVSWEGGGLIQITIAAHQYIGKNFWTYDKSNNNSLDSLWMNVSLMTHRNMCSVYQKTAKILLKMRTEMLKSSFWIWTHKFKVGHHISVVDRETYRKNVCLLGLFPAFHWQWVCALLKQFYGTRVPKGHGHSVTAERQN